VCVGNPGGGHGSTGPSMTHFHLGSGSGITGGLTIGGLGGRPIGPLGFMIILGPGLGPGPPMGFFPGRNSPQLKIRLSGIRVG